MEDISCKEAREHMISLIMSAAPAPLTRPSHGYKGQVYNTEEVEGGSQGGQHFQGAGGVDTAGVSKIDYK